MTHYEKIATIVVRALACSFLISAPYNWAMIAISSLLVSFGLFSRGSIAVESRLLMSIVDLAVGLALYVRSHAIAGRIVEGLEDDSDEPDDADQSPDTLTQ